MEALTPNGSSDHGPPDPLPEVVTYAVPPCEGVNCRTGLPGWNMQHGQRLCVMCLGKRANEQRWAETVEPLVGTGDP